MIFKFNPFRAHFHDPIHVSRRYLNGKKTLNTMTIIDAKISQRLTMC